MTKISDDILKNKILEIAQELTDFINDVTSSNADINQGDIFQKINNK